MNFKVGELTLYIDNFDLAWQKSILLVMTKNSIIL